MTGPLVRTKRSSVFHIPGEYREHSRNSTTYRSAAPFATDWGQIGQYTWSMHVTSK